MDIKQLNEAIKTTLKENTEYKELGELCEFVNEYISHFGSLDLIFGHKRKSNNGIIYLDNIDINDGQSYWVIDGKVVDDHTSGHGIDFSEYETENSSKEDYIFLLDVTYQYTYICDAIKKSDIDTIDSRKKIAEWLFTSAKSLLDQDEEHMDEFLNC